ncbi:SpoIIE family protein phosphatase [Kitasatospora sp. NPDC048296]|uniref:SpoIIE family protein phosphatase n=1 Tax=Kitasatospora sp. NPDC048296 TaxID=3364048 RepID=UPI00371AA3D9
MTDGVTEARDKRGAFYDPLASERMRRLFGDPDAVVDALTEDVGHWTEGERGDDMAILVVTRCHRPPRVA